MKAHRTDGVSLTSGIGWGGEQGGTCTIEVTKFDATSVEGTYEAALWNGITSAHATVSIAGSFRGTPKLP